MAKHTTSSLNGNISTRKTRVDEARVDAAIRHEHERNAFIHARRLEGETLYQAEIRLIEAGELEAPYKRMSATAAVELRNRNRGY